VRFGKANLAHCFAGEYLAYAAVGDQGCDVGWVDEGVQLDQLCTDEVCLGSQPPQEWEQFAGGEAVRFGCSGARGIGGVKNVDVETNRV